MILNCPLFVGFAGLEGNIMGGGAPPPPPPNPKGDRTEFKAVARQFGGYRFFGCKKWTFLCKFKNICVLHSHESFWCDLRL